MILFHFEEFNLLADFQEQIMFFVIYTVKRTKTTLPLFNGEPP